MTSCFVEDLFCFKLPQVFEVKVLYKTLQFGFKQCEDYTVQTLLTL
jgi:hypothetical protein